MHMEGELMLRRSLEESFSLLFSPAQDALLALLREHGKDEQAEALMRGELVTVNFIGCQLGDDGAEVIANFLKHDETATTIYLLNCSTGSPGAKAIAESLKHNQTVVLVDLLNNHLIGAEAAAVLNEALNHNVCVQVLRVPLRGSARKLQSSIKYLTETRNKILIPAAVRRTSLYLIASRRTAADAGILAIFPKEIVKMIAMEVWATRKEPIWINALTQVERTGKSGEEHS